MVLNMEGAFVFGPGQKSQADQVANRKSNWPRYMVMY